MGIDVTRGGHRWIVAGALLCMSCIAQAGLGDALGQTLAGTGETLGGAGSGLGRILDGTGGELSELRERLAGRYLEPTPGTTSFETAVEHQGLGRPVIYIRPAVENRQKAPAVILLHYVHGTPQTMANVVHAGALAADHGAWVILPSAVHRHWQESPWRPASNDDVGFIAAVIADAVKNHPIDAKRIYIAGLSNGGFMVNRFVCQRPSLIAGAAVVATSLRKRRARQCADATPLPMLLIDGTRDPLVPYNGRIGLLSVPETYDYWADRDGCDSAAQTQSMRPDRADDGTRVRQTENSDCDAGTAVRLFTVKDGGHAWPGGHVRGLDSRLGRVSQDIDATEQLWQFFQRFTRE